MAAIENDQRLLYIAAKRLVGDRRVSVYLEFEWPSCPTRSCLSFLALVNECDRCQILAGR
jgi:hypothetical protein